MKSSENMYYQFSGQIFIIILPPQGFGNKSILKSDRLSVLNESVSQKKIEDKPVSQTGVIFKERDIFFQKENQNIITQDQNLAAYTEKVYQDILRRQQLEQETDILEKKRMSVSPQPVSREETITTYVIYTTLKKILFTIFPFLLQESRYMAPKSELPSSISNRTITTPVRSASANHAHNDVLHFFNSRNNK